MSRLVRISLLFLLAASAETQANDSIVMSCSIPGKAPAGDELLEPRSPNEAVLLRQAPHGARWRGEHTLEVGWAGGKRLFQDKPPYNEPLEGVHWVYCGYNAKLNLHILLKEAGSVFTGVLLEERTGKILPGGEFVLFSPDQHYYLAYEQPDGQDGETIKLYRRSGELVWQGYNGILAADRSTVVADFEDMHWSAQDQLQASAHLDGGKIVAVTLTETHKGKREWLPKIKR